MSESYISVSQINTYIKMADNYLEKQYADYDVENRCDLSGVQAAENPFCRCGEVLSGAIEPFECGLFGKDCTPQSPIGACMSSSEGTCAAAYAAGGRL